MKIAKAHAALSENHQNTPYIYIVSFLLEYVMIKEFISFGA